MTKRRKAYCSATDRNVPVLLRPGTGPGNPPSVRDAQVLLCLDYGVRCTGALCPLFTPAPLDLRGPAGSEHPPTALR